jgi:hypothetical protein
MTHRTNRLALPAVCISKSYSNENPQFFSLFFAREIENKKAYKTLIHKSYHGMFIDLLFGHSKTNVL